MRPRLPFRFALLTGIAATWCALGSLSATPTIQYSSGDPTGDEQYMLELINRARMGPAQEGIFLTTQTIADIVSAYSFFNVSKPQIVSAFSVIPQAQPLAMNQYLLATARAQSADMKTFHYQGHVNNAGQTESDRVAATAYATTFVDPRTGHLAPSAALAENVYAPIGGPIATLLYGHVGLNIDWGVPDLGHRKAIMGLNDLPAFDYGTLREIGVGLTQNPAGGSQPLSWYITQDFGVVYDMSSGSFGPTITPFVVGVVYTDFDSDGFYSPGEGAGGVTVMPDVGDDFAITSTSGGYAFPLKNLPAGTTSVTLTFSGGPLGTRQIVRTVALNGTKNIKADVVLVADSATRLGNISTRLRFETGANVGIAGFVVGGTGSKQILLRAKGPSLTAFGVNGALSNPTMTIFDSSGTPIAMNDDWQTPASNGVQVMNTGMQPTDPRESALVLTLAPGAYTAIVSGVGGEMGIGLVEAFDLDPSSAGARAINLSTRGHVLTSDAVMIGGFIINGSSNRRVVIRAIGPSLTAFGVPGALAAPTLEVHDANNVIATVAGWQTGPSMAGLQTRGLAPSSLSESAIILTLPPGGYTAIVRGVNNTTGVGLVEVFDAEE